MNIQELRTKKAALFSEMKSVYDAVKQENRNTSSDDLAKIEKIQGDMSLVAREIDAAEQFRDLAAGFSQQQERVLEMKDGEKRLKAFDQYLRGGKRSVQKEFLPFLTDAQFRATTPQKTSPDSAGGFLVPEGWLGEVDAAKEFVGEVEGLARIINTQTGNILPFPKINDTATDAELKTEGAAPTVSDMTFGNTNLSAYTYATLVKVSDELTQDEAVNLGELLSSLAAQRMARKTNTDLTNGDGSSKPNGIITAATLGSTAVATNAITIAELFALHKSIDPAYRMSAKAAFMCNDSVYHTILQLGLTASQDYTPITILPDGTMTLFGKPVRINQNMASTLAANAKALLFGDFSGYAVRTVGGISVKVLRERYADEGNIGYMFYRRLDGQLISGGTPLKFLQMAAS
jgi:HK97 family phage major capsid protein